MRIQPAFFVLIPSLATAQFGQDKEAVLGATLAQDLREQTTDLNSETVRAYVARIGQSFAQRLPEARFRYQFSIITDDLGGRTHEPLSFPGGCIFIPAKLILEAQEEAEFAGMLAHAMAHIAERHSTRQATFGQIANYGTVPLIFMGVWTGTGDGALLPLGFLPIQRKYELEADALAVKIASDAGCDPAGLLRYITREQPADMDRSKLNSPLPSKEMRIAELEKAIQLLTPKGYSSNDEFFRIQQETLNFLPRPALKRPPRSKAPMNMYINP